MENCKTFLIVTFNRKCYDEAIQQKKSRAHFLRLYSRDSSNGNWNDNGESTAQTSTKKIVNEICVWFLEAYFAVDVLQRGILFNLISIVLFFTLHEKRFAVEWLWVSRKTRQEEAVRVESLNGTQISEWKFVSRLWLMERINFLNFRSRTTKYFE